MTVRGMTGDQMLDSLVQATGLRDAGTAGTQSPPTCRSTQSWPAVYAANFWLASQVRISRQNTKRRSSSEKTHAHERPAYGRDHRPSTRSRKRSRPLRTLRSMNAAEKIEALYPDCGACRKPRADELTRLVPYAGKRRPPEGSAHGGFSDVLWALLNSGKKEFLLNH